jgi:hypothetical protein
MLRYFVERQSVKYKGKMYLEGELLPETFTEKERFRVLYPSRIGTKEVPEVAKTISGTSPVKTPTSPGTVSETKVASPKPLNGTSTVKPLTTNKEQA